MVTMVHWPTITRPAGPVGAPFSARLRPSREGRRSDSDSARTELLIEGSSGVAMADGKPPSRCFCGRCYIDSAISTAHTRRALAPERGSSCDSRGGMAAGSSHAQRAFVAADSPAAMAFFHPGVSRAKADHSGHVLDANISGPGAVTLRKHRFRRRSR